MYPNKKIPKENLEQLTFIVQSEEPLYNRFLQNKTTKMCYMLKAQILYNGLSDHVSY